MFFRPTRTDEARAVPLMLSTLAAPSLFPVIFAGTKIATRTNWTPIEQLGVGDFVLTAEHGEQVITAMEVSTLDASSTKKMSNQWPVHIPEGVLGNSSPMIVAPDMQLVVEDDAAGLLFGQTCVSLKAEDLIGHRGISRAHLSTAMTRYTVAFDKGVSLVAEGGVFLDMPSPLEKELRFKALDARQARLLVRQMGEEYDTRRSRKIEPPPLKWSAPIVRKAEDRRWLLRDPSPKRLS